MEENNERTVLSYQPSEETHLHRVQAEPFVIDPNESYLPDGFPESISGPLVWKGEEVASKPEKWLLQLSEEDVKEIKGAMEVFLATGAPFKDISPETFSLSTELRERLSEVRDSLYDGLGFYLIRGLNSREHSIRENIAIHAGLTSYFGSRRGYMGAQGNDVLAHVRNITQHFPGQDIVSPSFTGEAMTFHTDLGDIVSIYTASKGTSGGSFHVSSSYNIYNELRATRPDVLRTLSEPFDFDTLHPNVPSYRKPLLHVHNGRVFLQSFRRPFTGFGNTGRSSALPALTAAQMLALDELHFAALRNCHTIDFEDGDVCLLNNLALLHARDRYDATAGPDADADADADDKRRRHLLKMFVRDAARAWEVPPVVQDQWDALYGDRTSPRAEDFPFEYPREGTVPNYGWSQNG